jgi:hypothetical protein
MAKPSPQRKDLPDVSRKIGQTVRYALVASAGGRCEFRGCNRYLFGHSKTKAVGNFGNNAHIRAFSPDGPRAGTAEERAGVDLNELDNLLLLCEECHSLVDTDVETYTLDSLCVMKRDHEERVTYLLELPQENEASVIEVWTSLSMPAVVRGQSKVIAALLPLYPSKHRSALVDLSRHNLSDLSLVPAATESIDAELREKFGAGGERPTHIAVFGITNVPLLVYLGAKLGDRQDARLFQYHRDTKDWKWKTEPPRAEYALERLSVGTEPKCVALVLSLSGSVDRADLPSEIDATHSVYEIRLVSDMPHVDFLRTLADLEKFRALYRSFLGQLQAAHGSLDELLVIPAVPIPVAISLGIDRLPKIHPALWIYDIDKNVADRRAYRRVLRIT